jgi:hypothetical protein
MPITDDGDGRFTYTPADFIECDFQAADPDWTNYPEDCWYTGAAYSLTYNVAGLDGRYVLNVCENHLHAAAASLLDDRRYPYVVVEDSIIKTTLADARDDAR